MLYQFSHTTAANPGATQYTIYASQLRPEVLRWLYITTYSSVVGGKVLTLYIYVDEALTPTSFVFDRTYTATVTNGNSLSLELYIPITRVLEVHVGTSGGYFAAPDVLRCTLATEELLIDRKGRQNQNGLVRSN